MLLREKLNDKEEYYDENQRVKQKNQGGAGKC
jgi:hypothetical protein